MHFFKSLRLATQLLTTFILVALIAGVVGFVGYKNIHKIDEADTFLYEKCTVALGHLVTINGRFQRYRRDLLIAATTKDRSTAEKHFDRCKEHIQKIKGSLDAYSKTLNSEESEALYKQMRGLVERFDTTAKTIQSLALSGKDKEAAAILDGDLKKIADALNPLMDRVNERQEKLGKEISDNNTKTASAADRQILMTIALGMLISIGLGALVTRLIKKQVGGEPKEALEVARRVATGDFSVEVAVAQGDTTSIMASIKDMADKLKGSFREVQASTFAITQASSEISVGNADLSRRTEAQAANLEETASALEEFTSTVGQTAENASTAASSATRTQAVAQEGKESVTRLVGAMDEINASSARINEIISVVDEIAFQTNLLALNAAVEAARAGEQGRGFAVVASEVRNLAKRSSDAAREIKDLIRDSTVKAQDGQKVAGRAGQIIDEVVANVHQVAEIIGDIAKATQEQMTGLSEINKAVSQMDAVTQKNAALVEEAAAAAESLDEQARNLGTVVGRFRTGEHAGTIPSGGARGAIRPAPTTPAMPQRPLAALSPVAQGEWVAT